MATKAQQARIRTLTAVLVAVVGVFGLTALTAPEFSQKSDTASTAAVSDPLRPNEVRTVHQDPASPARSGYSVAPETSIPSSTAQESITPPGSLAMDNRQLESLLQEGFLEVLHPEGGLLRIDLLRLEKVDTLRILQVESGGLRGVITERLGNWFATIATPTGVYTLERRNGHTRIANQQQLDLRANPDDRDYRHVPLA